MKKYVWLEIHPGYQNLIRNRIKESEREYTRQEQRAELLLRNPQFMQEYWTLQWAIQHPDEAREKGLKAQAIGDYDAAIKASEECWENLMEEICDRWRISRKWDATRASLSKFIETTPSLLYNAIRAGLPVDYSEVQRFPDSHKPDYFYIQIDPWTLPRDITTSWGRIEKLKKAIFGFSDHDKWNFSEALCWYDLRTKYRYSFGKIALLWQMEKAPHENEDDLKTRVRIGIKRIAGYIKRLTPAVELINIPQPEK